MLHVRAMFRVLSVSEDYAKRPLIKLGPTYQTRDGVTCEENKSFSKWTPSGECELTMEPGKLFEAGAYVYLDFYRAEDAPPVSEGALRTEWIALRYEVDIGGAQFTTRLYPAIGAALRGALWMTVTNVADPVLEMFTLDPRGGAEKRITVDFSAVP